MTPFLCPCNDVFKVFRRVEKKKEYTGTTREKKEREILKRRREKRRASRNKFYIRDKSVREGKHAPWCLVAIAKELVENK